MTAHRLAAKMRNRGLAGPALRPAPRPALGAILGANLRQALGLGLAVSLVTGLVSGQLSGCSAPTRIEHPPQRALLAPEVDSVVVRPFERAPGVELPPVELALLGTRLREAVMAREQLRLFDTPPTRLPNSVVLAGRLEALQVDERSGDGLALRTVDLTVALRVLPAEGDTPLVVLRRRTARQKLYAGIPMSTATLDLEEAMREVTDALAHALAPLPGPEFVPLRAADAAGGDAHPALARGNAAAAAGQYDRARLHWQAVLFNPAAKAGKRTYRITPATLLHLRAAGVPAAVLTELQPLTQAPAEPLVAFRQRLRAALGETTGHEGVILTLADVHFSIANANLAAAHANLAALAGLEGHLDLAAYHWARAWAHDPAPDLLERWQALQAERRLLPGDRSAEESLRLYLRIGPPATVQLLPGRFERVLLPPPAFGTAEAEVAAAAVGSPQDQTAAPTQAGVGTGSPAAITPQQTAPQRTGLPPVSQPVSQSGNAPAAAVEITTDSNPGAAATSGRSDSPAGTEGGASAAVPVESTPANP